MTKNTGQPSTQPSNKSIAPAKSTTVTTQKVIHSESGSKITISGPQPKK